MKLRNRVVLTGGVLLLMGGAMVIGGWLLERHLTPASPPNDPAASDAPPPKYQGRAADRQESATAFAFSPDGQTLATGDDAGTVLLSDATTGAAKSLLESDGKPVTAVAFSADGRIVAAREGGVVMAWDVRTGQLTTPQSGIEFRTFDADRKRWEQSNGHPLPLPAGVTAAALSPDGRTVAWADDDKQHADEFGFLWGTPNWRVAATADLGKPWTWEVVKAKLKDAPHRATRLEALGWMRAHARDPEMADARPLLEDRLRHDPDWRVREKAALRLVSEQKRDAAYPLALLEGFRDPDVCVRTAARYALMEYTNYPPGAVGDLLKSVAYAHSEETRAEALRRLAIICEKRLTGVRAVAGGLVPPHPDAERVLRATTVAMSDAHPEVRRVAHQTHSRVTGTVDAELLWSIRFTDDPEEVWPLATVDEMDQFGLTAEMKSASRNLRQLGAATRMASVCTDRPAEVADAMLRALDDPDPAVRKAVAGRVQMFASVSEVDVFRAVIPGYGLADPPGFGSDAVPPSETVLPELLARGCD